MNIKGKQSGYFNLKEKTKMKLPNQGERIDYLLKKDKELKVAYDAHKMCADAPEVIRYIRECQNAYNEAEEVGDSDVELLARNLFVSWNVRRTSVEGNPQFITPDSIEEKTI